MQVTPMLSVAIGMIIIPFTVAGVSIAASGSGGSSQEVLLAKLRSCSDCALSIPDAEGQTILVRKTGEGRAVFEGGVEIPFPNPGLGLNSEEDAEMTSVHILLNDGMNDYADCTLVLDRLELPIGSDPMDEIPATVGGVAQWRVSMKQRDGNTVTTAGHCSDSSTGVVLSDIPDVQEGHVSTATIQSQTVLRGTFEQR